MKTIKELCERSRVRVTFEKDPLSSPPFTCYRVHLHRRPNHGCGPLMLETSTVRMTTPAPEHILQALLDLSRFGELTFVDYCLDLDLSDDSIKAHRAWARCARIYNELKMFFGDKLYREFSDAVTS